MQQGMKVLRMPSAVGRCRLWLTLCLIFGLVLRGIALLPAAAAGIRQVTLRGHADMVTAVLFSPDGRQLVSVDGDVVVKVWDTASWRPLATLKAHTEKIWQVAFSPNGKYLAIASWDHTVTVWDTAGWKQLATLRGHAGDVTCVAFSPDSRHLASGGGHKDYTVRVWDTANWKPRGTLRGHALAITTLAFSPEGKYLAAGGRDRSVRVWHTATGKFLTSLQGHPDWVITVMFSPDGKKLFSRSQDRERVWDTATWKLLTIRQAAPGTMSLDRKYMVAASSAAIELWRRKAVGWEALALLKGHADWITALAFSPDGRYLASGSHDKTAKIWDTSGWRVLLPFHGHAGTIRALVFSPDGRYLASGGEDRAVKVWDSRRWVPLRTLKGHSGPINGIAFSPDGRYMATGVDHMYAPPRIGEHSQDHAVILWRTSDWTSLRTLPDSDAPLVFSANGRQLHVSGAGFEIAWRRWEVATGRLLAYRRGSEVAAFCRGGNCMATVQSGYPGHDLWSHSQVVQNEMPTPSVDQADRRMTRQERDHIQVWDMDKWKILATLGAHPEGTRSVAFSQDSKYLASGGGDPWGITETEANTVKLWQVATGRLLATFERHAAAVTAVAFSPDSQYLASGSHDGTVKLWNVSGKNLLRVLREHSGTVDSVAFSPDGKRLAVGGCNYSGSDDRCKAAAITVWGVPAGQILATLGAIVVVSNP